MWEANREFLEAEDVKPCGWDVSHEDERHPKWAGERARYGFDSRETWSLDYSMVVQLFERLKLYREVADPIIDLTFHKFEWEGEELTQLEAIDRLLELCRDYFQDDDVFGSASTRTIWELWALISPAMWW